MNVLGLGLIQTAAEAPGSPSPPLSPPPPPPDKACVCGYVCVYSGPALLSSEEAEAEALPPSPLTDSQSRRKVGG